MATLLRRTILNHSRRPILYTMTRGQKKQNQLAPVVEKEEKEEKEFDTSELEYNFDDLYNIKCYKRDKGSKDDPNLVPSYFESRIVGCLCEEESMQINWMWVHMDQPRRCECGFWFKLVPKTELRIEDDLVKLGYRVKK